MTNVLDNLLSGGKWDESDYASLRLRLDLFDDYILARRFEGGQPGALFMVDPLDVAAKMSGLSIGTGLLPRDCLFWQRVNGIERLAVAIAPAVWRVTISGQPNPLAVPLPWLVFEGQGVEYRLFAATERPAGESRLYKAPSPNVGNNGKICLGNVLFPTASAGTIWSAWEAFISSDFNRDLSNQKSRAFPNGVLLQWQYLDKTQIEAYPVGDMEETSFTLADLVKGVKL